jgi:hypothetical protein
MPTMLVQVCFWSSKCQGRPLLRECFVPKANLTCQLSSFQSPGHFAGAMTLSRRLRCLPKPGGLQSGVLRRNGRLPRVFLDDTAIFFFWKVPVRGRHCTLERNTWRLPGASALSPSHWKLIVALTWAARTCQCLAPSASGSHSQATCNRVIIFSQHSSPVLIFDKYLACHILGRWSQHILHFPFWTSLTVVQCFSFLGLHFYNMSSTLSYSKTKSPKMTPRQHLIATANHSAKKPFKSVSSIEGAPRAKQEKIAPKPPAVTEVASKSKRKRSMCSSDLDTDTEDDTKRVRVSTIAASPSGEVQARAQSRRNRTLNELPSQAKDFVLKNCYNFGDMEACLSEAEDDSWEVLGSCCGSGDLETFLVEAYEESWAILESEKKHPDPPQSVRHRPFGCGQDDITGDDKQANLGRGLRGERSLSAMSVV